MTPCSHLTVSCVHAHVCRYVSAVGEVGKAAPAFRPECLGAHFQMVMRLIRRKRAEWKYVIICLTDNRPTGLRPFSKLLQLSCL